MNLQTELERVREYGTEAAPPPSNEANTCDWIIAPLLRQCGYNYHDIHAQGHDAAGGIPDYTILPNTPQTWFLEAKAWKVALTDAHVVQAINYAHTQGKRWVVLSNGHEWRLYDDHIVGVGPADRLVAVARLDCGTELEELLAALSKPSMQSSGLDKFALITRLDAVLRQELVTASSNVVQAIVGVLKNKSGLSAITSDAVAGYFQSGQSSSVNDPKLAPSVSIPTDKNELPLSFTSLSKNLTLPELLAEGSAAQGRKLVQLTCPDGSTKPVLTWRNVTIGVAEWLFTHGKTPQFPFRGQKGGQRCLLNTVPFHLDGAEMTNKVLDVNGQSIYVHVNRSSADFLRCLISLCKEVGESPEGFRVTLQ